MVAIIVIITAICITLICKNNNDIIETQSATKITTEKDLESTESSKSTTTSNNETTKKGGETTTSLNKNPSKEDNTSTKKSTNNSDDKTTKETTKSTTKATTPESGPLTDAQIQWVVNNYFKKFSEHGAADGFEVVRQDSFEDFNKVLILTKYNYKYQVTQKFKQDDKGFCAVDYEAEGCRSVVYGVEEKNDATYIYYFCFK